VNAFPFEDLLRGLAHELLERVDRKLRVEAHAVGEFFLLEDDLERVTLGPVKRFQLEDDVPYIATNRR
jgi:hypothetical protein